MKSRQRVRVRQAPDTITISYDRLRSALHDAFDRRQNADAWHAPLGVFLTLVVALSVSDFSTKVKRLGLSGSTWQTVLLLATGAAALWMLTALVRVRRTIKLDALMEELVEVSATHRTERAVFIVKRHDVHEIRFLVYEDPEWACLLLPSEGLDKVTFDERNDRHLRAILGSRFGCDAELIGLQYLEGQDLRSTKPSPGRDGAIVHYHFRFFLVTLRDFRLSIDPHFELQRVRYQWMTILEMQHDDACMSHNHDVVHHLRDRAVSVLSQPIDSQ